MGLFDFTHWVEAAKNVCEILAILGGAAWTYLNYFRGRTYKLKLECTVEAFIEKSSAHRLLKATIKIKNIGLSKVPIQQQGSGFLIYSARIQDQRPTFPSEIRWNEPVAAFEVLSGEKWLEPSEPLAESLKVDLPDRGHCVYKVTLTVVSGKTLWTAQSIVGDTGTSG